MHFLKLDCFRWTLMIKRKIIQMVQSTSMIVENWLLTIRILYSSHACLYLLCHSFWPGKTRLFRLFWLLSLFWFVFSRHDDSYLVALCSYERRSRPALHVVSQLWHHFAAVLWLYIWFHAKPVFKKINISSHFQQDKHLANLNLNWVNVLRNCDLREIWLNRVLSTKRFSTLTFLSLWSLLILLATWAYVLPATCFNLHFQQFRSYQLAEK